MAAFAGFATLVALRGSVRNWVGATAKRAGERAGLEVARSRPPGPRRAMLMEAHGIELVIDVGANRGQYARELRSHGYPHRIVSFEPSADAFGELLRHSAADAGWSVRREAVSEADGILELGEANNFSSILPVADELAALFPEAAPRRREPVQARRLDAAGLELPPRRRTLLKLDVQGYEREALTGAQGILESLGIIETELSITPLYIGQALVGEIVSMLAKHDYQLVELNPLLRDRSTGRYLQYDGLFVKC